MAEGHYIWGKFSKLNREKNENHLVGGEKNDFCAEYIPL